MFLYLISVLLKVHNLYYRTKRKYFYLSYPILSYLPSRLFPKGMGRKERAPLLYHTAYNPSRLLVLRTWSSRISFISSLLFLILFSSEVLYCTNSIGLQNSKVNGEMASTSSQVDNYKKKSGDIQTDKYLSITYRIKVLDGT